MKFMLSLTALLLAANSAYASTIVCAIKERANPKNYASVVMDLEKAIEDYYIDENGIDVGDDNYSFNVGPTITGDNVDMDAVFFENKHVQDEVGSYSWSFKISEAKKGAISGFPHV